MAVTATLVDSTPNRLRYLLANPDESGGSVTIPNDGGATPDLLTDLAAEAGELRTIVRARLDGIGPIPAGTALTQAQARAIMNSDDPTSAVLTNNNVPRAVLTLSKRTTQSTEWVVDVNVDGGGDPIITATCSAASGRCYLDIHARHSYDL